MWRYRNKMGYKCYFNKEGLIFSKTNAYINIFLDNIAFRKQHAEWTVTSDSVYCESLYFWHFCEMVFVEADFEGLRRTIIKACLKERMGIRGSRVHRSKTNWFHLFRQPRAEERVGVVFDISSCFIYCFKNGILNTRTQLWFIKVCFRQELWLVKTQKQTFDFHISKPTCLVNMGN